MRRSPSMVIEPNVVPMIDVMLVLLVIFILANVADVRRAFDVQLPQPSPQSEGGMPIVLSVSAGPTYSINREAVPTRDLEERLRTIFARRQEKVLFVDAERSLPYQAVINALDAARGAGVTVSAVVPKR